MHSPVGSPNASVLYPPIRKTRALYLVPDTFAVDQAVEYYSSTHGKWVNTVVVRLHEDTFIDLKCRTHAPLSQVRAITPTIVVAGPIALRELEDDAPIFPVGAKVEYYSDTLSAWVPSRIKGVNTDGTYRLSTKRSADARRIRLAEEPKSQPSTIVRPILISAKPGLGRKSPYSTDTASTSAGSISNQPAPLQRKPFVATVPFIHSLYGTFDLASYSSTLFSLLNLHVPNHTLIRMRGFSGGQNEGIWYVCEKATSHRLYCVKAVKSGRKFASVLSELENYKTLLERFDGIRDDSSVSFPIKVVTLMDRNNAVYDLIVMPVALGERMSEAIGRRVKGVRWKEDVQEVFAAVGRRLQEFHQTYAGTQHGDFQTSNIYIQYKESGTAPAITLIDLGGMGQKTQQTDVEYFCESIRLLAKTYGAEFELTATNAFMAGYGTS